MRNVGVALSQATLQELALSMGIEKNVADMSEAEKAQLRYIQILKSTTEWQTDMGATLVTPANALRVLKQQFTLLARAIGSVFIPVLMKLVPYIMVITQALTNLAKRLAALFGYEIQEVDYDRISTGLGGISDGIQDIGDNASKSAKKLNTMLAPFDELNVVQNQNEKAGSGSGADDISDTLGLALGGYDALAKLNDGFKKDMVDAEKTLKRILPVVAAIGLAFATWKIFKGTMNFLSLFAEGGTIASGLKVASKMASGLGLSLGSLLVTVTALAAAFAIGVKTSSSLSKAFDDLHKNGTSLEESFNKLSTTQKLLFAAGSLTPLGMVLNGFVILKNLIQELREGKSIGEIFTEWFPKTSQTISNIMGVLSNFVQWVNSNFVQPVWKAIEPLVTSIGSLFMELFSIARNVFGMVKNVIVSSFKVASSIVTPIISGIGEIIGTIAPIVLDIGSMIVKIVGTSIGNVYSIVRPFLSFTLNTVIGNITGKIQGLVSIVRFINTNIVQPITQTISNLATSVSNKASNIKTSFTNAFKGILTNVTNILNQLKNKFSNWKAKLKTPHIQWQSDGIKVKGALKKALETLNLPTSLPKLSVSWYAEGGYPKDGEFFVANENGPEMIGKIGNRSAVANNDQITSSITNALINALDNYDFGGGKSPTTIYIGNKKVYEGYGDYANSENDRYGTNTIRI